MVMLQTNFSYKKDNDGYYREVLADGALSDKRFKRLENLAGWVRVKFRLKILGFLVILSLVFVVIYYLFLR